MPLLSLFTPAETMSAAAHPRTPDALTSPRTRLTLGPTCRRICYFWLAQGDHHEAQHYLAHRPPRPCYPCVATHLYNAAGGAHSHDRGARVKRPDPGSHRRG